MKDTKQRMGRGFSPVTWLRLAIGSISQSDARFESAFVIFVPFVVDSK
jgi:hypothetical protein